jgi:hypothetical protein
MSLKEKPRQNGDPIPNVVSVENSDVPFNIVERDDGLWPVGWCDEAPGPFDSRADAVRIASGAQPAPAPVAKCRHFVVTREVRRHGE